MSENEKKVKELSLDSESNLNNSGNVVKEINFSSNTPEIPTINPTNINSNPTSSSSTSQSGFDFTSRPSSSLVQPDVMRPVQPGVTPLSVSNSNQTKSSTPIPSTDGIAPVENTFYTKRKPTKDKWYKRKSGKITIIATTIVVIGLSVGLGLYYGLSGGTSNWMNINNPSGDVNEDAFEDYLENVEQENWANQIEALKSQAVVWAYDQASSAIPNADKKKQDAEEKADKDIEAEKDQYRSDYGSSWEKEWDKFIISSGYDNEEQYKNSKISSSLESEVSSLYTNSGGMTEIVETPTVTDTTTTADGEHQAAMDAGHWYVSTEAYKHSTSTTTYLLGIKNGGLDEEGNFEPNIQKYLTLYFQTYKPVNAIDMLLPFTISGAPQDGFQPGAVTFADVTQFQVTYDNMSDLAMATGVAGDAYYFDLLSRMEVVDGVKSLTAPAYTHQSMTNAIVAVLFFGETAFETFVLPSPNTTTPTDGFRVLTPTQAFDFYYSLHESAGYYVAGQAQINSNGGWEWPGYVDPATGLPSTPPADVATKMQSIADVNLENDKYITQQFASSDINEIGKGLANNLGWIQVAGKTSSDKTKIEYRPIAILSPADTFSGKVWNTPTAINDMFITTFSTDGIHMTTFFYVAPAELSTGFGNDSSAGGGTNNTIYFFDDLKAPGESSPADPYLSNSYVSSKLYGVSVIGERQLISDLNQEVDIKTGTTDDAFAPNYIPKSGFGILTDFGTWMTNNFRTLALNEALNDPEFRTENHLDNTPITSDDLMNNPENHNIDWSDNSEDDGWTKEEEQYKYQSILNNFYNSIYQTQHNAWTSSYTSFKNHIEKYDKIYFQIDFTNPDFYQTWQANAMWWEHLYQADTNGDGGQDGWFVYNSIYDVNTGTGIIVDGGLI